ncbi:hypothetical protein GSI_12945 [Ganoderma sinense ZZ0214-1]|uniref:Uncharacterized protein n=1 Tax=Ganoderma sinense ZZ0214-1 TaxID=1077348 RepID=A0A2G8RU59_9APHY|nr:hypothetical protein GSI_12945 [Ganoderma sinense ZZ0214-1]
MTSDEPTLTSDTTRPMSIDLSLELERQLEAESVPNSPNPPRPPSLDATVLATIVTHLRHSLAETTRERDTLAEKLAEAQTREEGMRDTLEHVTDKCIKMENDLEVASNRQKEDEETIAMLRSKLEESRRALMRLQTERRMSVASNLSLDLSRPPPVLPSLSGPPSSKRASFAPLTGSPAGRGNLNHRRISSISDSGFLLTSSSTGEPPMWPPTSPISQHIPQDPECTPTDRYSSTAKNKRISLLFGRGTTPLQESSSEIEVGLLRKQLHTAQQQLEDTKHELVEAQEAHEASELCVRALRTFISENNVGMPPLMQKNRSPAAPTNPSHSKQGSTASRWGFRLWTTSDSDSAKSPISAPTSLSNHPSEPSSTVSTHSQTVHRTLGGFFGTKINASSNASSHLPYDSIHNEAMYNSSDTSSLADSTGPISPASEAPQCSADLDGNATVAEGAKPEMTAYEHTRELSVASVA